MKYFFKHKIWKAIICLVFVTVSYAQPSYENMVYIKGGTFEMGGDNNQAEPDELPKHKVTINGFWIDITEVTNAQFEAFVKATNYITTAEKPIDWEVLKQNLAPETPKPNEKDLEPSSLVFEYQPEKKYWWNVVKGANWRHPSGPDSDIVGKGDYPVVHISWFDAIAYCKWAKKRLPTEAEWEFASRGGLKNNVYSWGNDLILNNQLMANFWQGTFPTKNLLTDAFYKIAPVKSFAKNGYGLYDMAGNVWEWCADWYDYRYYKISKNMSINPKGLEKSYDPYDIYAQKRSLRGGSFLCSEAFCSGYRNARRMKETPDTSTEHIGFRCVAD